jgi:hypothetical protein
MSWFFGGGDKKKEESNSYQESSYPESSFDNTQQFTAPSAPTSYGGNSSVGSTLEQELLVAQQRALIQQVMFKLTEAAFDSCVSKPSSSLSSSEQHCITSVVGKYLEASEFLVAKMSAKK